MDVQLEADTGDMGLDGLNDHASRGDHNTQADHSSATVDHSEATSEEAPSLDRTNQMSCDSHLTGEVTTSEDTSPIPHGASDLTQRTEFTTCEKRLKHSSIQSGQVTNGAPPIRTSPSLSTGRLSWSPPQSTKNNGQVHLDKKHLPSTSTANSQHSLKTTSQIQQAPGDDCCVHCVLACLFCELWSLCSVMVQCLACGQGCEALCCCGSEATGDMACGEDACCDALDCGILEDCCESSDCLEICLECCSICFPA
ncbi:myoD family inhibitor [Brienomyrus brachyistius]|uniref:myoD family inhibitor n=1 Tax=Brienomyrus brachyistius TaxID=42636 RepID=UPI0020B316EE|nr:myoD family inhibitor [Brienomyrus brachyistius]